MRTLDQMLPKMTACNLMRCGAQGFQQSLRRFQDQYLGPRQPQPVGRAARVHGQPRERSQP
jgi:hypothetical protein